MAKARIATAFLIGGVTGGVIAWLMATQQAKVAVFAGPYSDNYGPALTAIAEAKVRLNPGDTDVLRHLLVAEDQIRAAQRWSEWFLGHPKRTSK